MYTNVCPYTDVQGSCGILKLAQTPRDTNQLAVPNNWQNSVYTPDSLSLSIHISVLETWLEI